MQSRDNLIWIDLEMTGLRPDSDVIIEIATVVTDSRPAEARSTMNRWRLSSASGLLRSMKKMRCPSAET